MIIIKIVYNSNSGHTEEYAKLLGKKLNIEINSLKEYKKDDEPIIFMGWVFGNIIMGLDKIKESNPICICAVGMNEDDKKNIDNIIKINNCKIPIFYLRGGVDYNKLKGLKKIILKMVGKKIIKENKPENQEIIEVFKNGGNFVKKENLKQVIDFLKQN